MREKVSWQTRPRNPNIFARTAVACASSPATAQPRRAARNRQSASQNGTSRKWDMANQWV